MTERIFALAKTLGHVGSEDEEALRELCALAEEELRGRLREDVSVEDCEAAFPMGAAWLALAGLCVSEDVESFTAGDVTVKRGRVSPPERSAALRRQGENVMAPYLRDDAFVFRAIRATRGGKGVRR